MRRCSHSPDTVVRFGRTLATVRLQRRARTRGFPPSGNGASSFHLRWDLPPEAGHLVAAAATLEVLEAPVGEHLYFWALQVSFPGAGVAHLGLQWNNRHPGFGAVNWGGYASDGSLLRGTPSPLPSAPDDPNTRDFPWQPRRAYRLHASRAAPGAWRGDVTDLTTGTTATVRDLEAAAEFLAAPLVWSEVFARCDSPSVVVRWSDLVVETERGDRLSPGAVVTSYQSHHDGGCANTDCSLDRDGVLQCTNCERVTAPGAHLRLSI
jgi:hypothetical protein